MAETDPARAEAMAHTSKAAEETAIAAEARLQEIQPDFSQAANIIVDGEVIGTTGVSESTTSGESPASLRSRAEMARRSADMSAERGGQAYDRVAEAQKALDRAQAHLDETMAGE